MSSSSLLLCSSRPSKQLKPDPKTKYKSPLLGLLLPTLLIIFSVAFSAQPKADESVATPRITPETVIRYLQQDVFIKPGVGFRKVSIGRTFQEVMQTWGNPNKAYDSDVGSRIAWVYQLDNDSQVAITGKDIVESIEITGSFNSPFSTSQGATFGMTPHQVISMYGAPTGGSNLAKLNYPDKGIAFGFRNGSLHHVKVFAPNR